MDPQDEWNKFAEDFTLFLAGEFDEDLGDLVALPAKMSLGTIRQLIDALMASREEG